MKKRYVTENFFKTTLSQQVSAISDSGDPLTEFTIYLSKVPANNEGWIILDFADAAKRDLIYYHAKTSSTVTYYRKNRDLLGNGARLIAHKKNSYCQVNDVAELFNYLFSNTDDFGHIINYGTNKIKVMGGKCYYSKALHDISDTSILTLTDGTWNIVLDYTDHTLKAVPTISGESQLHMAVVIVASGNISSITDSRSNQLQANKDTIDGFTTYAGNVLWNGTPLGGGAGTGDIIGPNVSGNSNLMGFANTSGKVAFDTGVSVYTMLDRLGMTANTADTLVIGTVYRAGSKGGTVVALGGYGGTITILSDANNPPTTTVGLVWSNNSSVPNMATTAVILPNMFYKVVGGSSAKFYYVNDLNISIDGGSSTLQLTDNVIDAGYAF